MRPIFSSLCRAVQSTVDPRDTRWIGLDASRRTVRVGELVPVGARRQPPTLAIREVEHGTATETLRSAG